MSSEIIESIEQEAATFRRAPMSQWTPAALVAAWSARRHTNRVAAQIDLTLSIRRYGEFCAKRALRKYMRRQRAEREAHSM